MTHNDNLRRIWSEEDLDRALSALNEQPPAGDLSRQRAELVEAAGGAVHLSTDQPVRRPERSGRRPGWGAALVAATAVLALVGGGFVVKQIADRQGVADPASTSRDPGTRLTAAANKITQVGPVVAGPGQFTYFRRRGLSRGYEGQMRLIEKSDQLSESWAPADKTKPWRADTVSRNLLKPGEPPQRKTSYARCGDFFAPPKDQCKTTKRGGFEQELQVSQEEWLAGLPRDPQGMLARLQADRVQNGRNSIQLMVHVIDFLAQPGVPADVRKAIFGALALLPDLRMLEGVEDMDGRIGTAFGVAEKSSWLAIIVDEKTGEYLGHREASLDAPPVGAGDKAILSSYREGVVDKVGERP